MQRRKELGEFISYHRHRQQLFGHGQVRNQVEFGRERHKNSKFPPIGNNSKFPPIGNNSKFFPITNRGKLTIVRRFVEKKKKQTFLTKLVRTIRKRIGVLSRGCLVSNVSLEKILLNKEMLKLIGRSNVGIRFKRIKKRLTKRLNKVKLKQRELKCIFNLLRDEGVSRQESLRLLKPLIRINGFKRRKLSCLIRKFKRNCKRRRRTLGRIVKEQAKELLFFWGRREKAFSLDKLTQGYWKNRKRLRWKFPFANRLFFKKAISVISNSFISFSSTKGVQEREFDKFCNEASMYFHEERKHLYWFRNSSWKGYAFAKVRKKEQRVKRFWSEKKPSGSTNLFRGLFQKALRLRLYKDKKLGIQQMVNYARINRFKAIGVEKGRTMAMLKTGVVRRKRRFGLSPRALQLLRRRILRGRAINNRNKRKKNALFRRLRKALFLRVVHLLQSLTQGQKRNKETLLVAASLVKLAARLSPRLSVKYKCKNYTVPRYKAKPYISKVPNSSAKYNYLLMQDNLPRKGLYSSSGISAEQGKWLKPETIKGSNISYIKFLPVKANLWQGKVKSLRNNYAVSFVQGLQRLKFLFLAYNDFAMMAALRRKKNVQFSERTRFYWITLLLRNIVKVAKVRRRVKSILVGYVARFLQRHFSGYLLRIRIIYIRNNFVNATLLANYLVAKFRMKYNLGTLMSIIFNTFFYKMGFRGVLVVASGRFTRAERATFKRRRRGRLSTSTLDFPVEYYLSQVALKYGACGLKVVVCRFKKFNHSFWRFGDEKI